MSEVEGTREIPSSETKIESPFLEFGAQLQTKEVGGINWKYRIYGKPIPESGIANDEADNYINVHGWLGSSSQGNERMSLALAGIVPNTPETKTLQVNSQDPELTQDPASTLTAARLLKETRDRQGKVRVINPDLPGFGETQPLDNASLDAMADSLVEFTKATFGEKSPTFIGTSMGGILAIKAEARHPGTFKGIVLQGTMVEPKDMAAAPGMYYVMQAHSWPPVARFAEWTEKVADNLSARGSRFAGVMDKLRLGRTMFKRGVEGSLDYRMADEGTQKLVMDAFPKMDTDTMWKTYRELGRDITEDISKITCPGMIIDGAAGNLVPAGNSEKNAKLFSKNLNPNGESPEKVIFIPVGGLLADQGHNLVNTAPMTFARWVSYARNIWYGNEQLIKDTNVQQLRNESISAK
jgi:pimeloyl-ACP methyl ester carboxylesterase